VVKKKKKNPRINKENNKTTRKLIKILKLFQQESLWNEFNKCVKMFLLLIIEWLSIYIRGWKYLASKEKGTSEA
jgi:hypothetical protein